MYSIKLILLLALFLSGGICMLGAFNNWKWLKKMILGKRAKQWQDSISSIALGLIGAVLLALGLIILF